MASGFAAVVTTRAMGFAEMKEMSVVTIAKVGMNGGILKEWTSYDSSNVVEKIGQKQNASQRIDTGLERH